MSFEIRYSSESVKQLESLRAFDSAAIIAEIENVLMVNPTLVSKARVKKLRQPAPTEYRLRVGDFRVFYDVDAADRVVNVIQILSKDDAIAFLKGNP
jgi:mRNA-degrading endonuclease RelE of RelBE toxin-antitoxin system